VLVLQGEHDLVSGVISADNRVSDQLGESQATVSLVLNSPFGGGERFVATFAGHPESNVFTDEAVRRYLALGMTAPVGADGLMFGLSADYSSTRPEGAVAPQALHSEYSRVGASLSYPFLRSRAANIVGRAQFDAVSDIQRTELGGPPEQSLSADRLRVLRLRLDGDVRLGGGARVEYGLGVSQGFDGMGARSASDASVFKPLTRAGADAEFSALDAEVRFSTPALFGTTLALSARAQDSFGDPLLRSEQFSPTSWDGLTGPPPGAMIGDSGGVARIELGRAFGPCVRRHQRDMGALCFRFGRERQLGTADRA
jgi:hemolysin activation/secretion protein